MITSFEPSHKKYTKGGIIPFFPPVFSNKIAGKIQQILADDLDNEICAVICQNLRENFDAFEWGKKITTLGLDCLEIRMGMLTPDNKKFADNELRVNGLFYHFITQFKRFFPGVLEKVPMDAILGLEPINNEAIDRYQHNCFGYFGGNREKKDLSILNTAIRETKEEGRIMFGESIMNDSYQRNLRYKIGCDKFPLYFDVKFKNTDMYSRIFLIMVDSDASILDIEEDSKKYILLYYNLLSHC